MIDIPTGSISPEFFRCWQFAIRHLESCGEAALTTVPMELLLMPPKSFWEGGACVWLKSELRPPFLEHLSFRLGNQLFFVHIEDVDGKLDVPGLRRGTRIIAEKCGGHACLLPMARHGSEWEPIHSGWGLTVLFNRNKSGGRNPSDEGYQPINPPDLLTTEKIVMTDWELQDTAVQVVRNSLPHEKLMSWNTNPDVMPSLWFVGDTGPEWVVIKAVCYPETDALPPDNIGNIAEDCARLSRKGNFAVVSLAGSGGGDPYDDADYSPGLSLPLYRGHMLHFGYRGLRSLNFG